MTPLTPKQRMLNAYRGIKNDRIAVAPEFWYYYPAKLLGVDMIEFELEVPFHQALKTTFEKYNCEGWGVVFTPVPNEKVTVQKSDCWIDNDTLEVKETINTPHGQLISAKRYSRQEPSWVVDRPVKDIERDFAAWELFSLGGEPENIDVAPLIKASEEVGDSYLLEAWLGVPFFDFYATSRAGSFETGIFDLINPAMSQKLKGLQEKYIDYIVRLARVICEKTPLESVCVGCEWSCNSLLGSDLWRQWDKPVIKAVADEVHRHNKLLHIHFHGKSMEAVADFAEIRIDCVCPFERPPGGDIEGLEDLQTVAKILDGRVTMNGNIHTVSTLIRGTPDDVRREVRQVLQAFKGNSRVILGTGDQVGRETPEENIHAMVDEVATVGIY